MAFGSNSKVFRAYIASLLADKNIDMDGDTFKVPLWNNSVTPDQDASAANTAYNAGTWLTANEVSQTSQWASGGETLAGKSVNSGTSAVVFFDATDQTSGSAATLTAYGCTIYDDTVTTPVADQGCSYHSFNGAASVTGGTLTVVWHSSGIHRYAL